MVIHLYHVGTALAGPRNQAALKRMIILSLCIPPCRRISGGAASFLFASLLAFLFCLFGGFLLFRVFLFYYLLF
jgi:hypothetical protein